MPSTPPPLPEQLQTPALLIHLDRVRHNLGAMRRFVAGDLSRWRPHIKTCKVAEVLALYLEAGVRRFKCATTREAEVLLRTATTAGHDIDVLFAMAQHGANLDHLQALAADQPNHRVAMISEDPTHAADLASRGLGVFVDIDPGYHRTGIQFGDRARIEAVTHAAGPGLRGLHCYDGHLHDDSPALRQLEAHEVYRELLTLAARLGIRGELITSGTPTFACALSFDGFRGLDGRDGLTHTISPGTVIYWDARSEELGIDGFRCAVEILARVISRPANDRFTLDAGSKALDAAAGTPCARLLEPLPVEIGIPSEEHLPIRMLVGHAPALGTTLRLVPRHVCPTVNLASEAVLLDGGAVTAIVPVTARGHETAPVAPATRSQDTRPQP
ncbi:MAG: alanine racemase [Planctomycetes bacterium]|nr:alanine racemase [Planctomycetota bacterium]